MASISTAANGTRSIQFKTGDQRHILRLGKCTKRQSEKHRDMVESLLGAKHSGVPYSTSVADYLKNLDDVIFDRLVRFDLVPLRERSKVPSTLSTFVDHSGH